MGKIYVGLLISENWKAYKASQINGQPLRLVSWGLFIFYLYFCPGPFLEYVKLLNIYIFAFFIKNGTWSNEHYNKVITTLL